MFIAVIRILALKLLYKLWRMKLAGRYANHTSGGAVVPGRFVLTKTKKGGFYEQKRFYVN